MKRSRMRCKLLSIAMGMVATTAASLQSEAAENEGKAPVIEQIMITARKVEESQQSVPVSVTALSAKDLESNAVLSIDDLQTNMTGLIVAPNFQGGMPTFSIRGAKEDNGTSAKVSVYIDDVAVWSTLSAANMMYDLSSVDTLKGPQGTLFGANSTAGAVIIRPNKPTANFEGYAEVGAGNWNRKQFQGMVNIPFSEAVMLRIAGDVVRRDGFEKNISPGASPSRLDDDRHESGRVTLRIKPSTNFVNDILADYFHKDQQPNNAITVATRGSYAGYPLPDPESRILNLDATDSAGKAGGPLGCGAYGVCPPTWDKATTWGIQDVASFDFNDDVTFKNVLAYRKDKTDYYARDTSLPFTSIHGRTFHDSKKWSEEASVHIDALDKRLRSQAGVYFERQDLDTGNAFALFWVPGITPATLASLPAGALPVPLQQNNFYTRKFDERAVYGQTSYDLSKELTVTLGVRYSWDKGDYTIQPRSLTGSGGDVFGTTATANAQGTGANPVLFNYGGDFFAGGLAACNVNGSLMKYDNPDPSTCTAHKSQTSRAPSFNFTLEDRFADTSMVYASLRGGYIRGGFNNNAPVPQNQTFKPEKVTDFEVGIKSDWELWNRPIRTNLDVFYGNYKNLQSSQVGSYVPSPGAAPVTYIAVFNAGASTFYGTDLEIKYQPLDHLSLGLNWTHLEAEFTNFCGVLPINSQGCIDLAGKAPGQTPKDTINLSTTLSWPLAANLGRVSSTVTYFWRDDSTARDVPTVDIASGQSYTQYDKLPAFSLINFTTDWKDIFGSNVDAQFWVRNLTDKLYTVYITNQLYLSGNAAANYGPPREIGVNLRYNF